MKLLNNYIDHTLLKATATKNDISCSNTSDGSIKSIKQDFDSQAANQMHPSQLNIDFKNQQWVANFNI